MFSLPKKIFSFSVVSYHLASRTRTGVRLRIFIYLYLYSRHGATVCFMGSCFIFALVLFAQLVDV